jgi:hypothetical protein
MADALWLSGAILRIYFLEKETQYYLDSMYLLADTADTGEEKEQKQDNQNMSQSFALEAWRYYHRYDWDHSRKGQYYTLYYGSTAWHYRAAPSKVHFLYASLHYTLVGRKE